MGEGIWVGDEQDDCDSPEEAIELVARMPRYEWADSPDEERRAFVLEHLASPEIDGKVLIANMQRAFLWLKYGAVAPVKDKLKVVEAE